MGCKPITHDKTGKIHSFFEDFVEEVAILAGVSPVNFVVGTHKRTDTGFNTSLKLGQIDFVEGSFIYVYIRG